MIGEVEELVVGYGDSAVRKGACGLRDYLFVIPCLNLKINLMLNISIWQAIFNSV